ncbi:DUF294 nucleotidyltransferase-like domain-containing protein [Bacillus sp. FJAT-45037]|uniref:DUF294 nucleotidyltransferase-like domain-containing protein n=1 Tax=Bacillus sp. FJAT-45037 TaxID=2011007 RepID=UPI000C2419CB|nr:DUF294 nucleotidyltransferase-like domain-containing protein [Bacillus sp. FJAT-45037]
MNHQVDNQYLQQIEAHPLFIGTTADELRGLLETCQFKHYDKSAKVLYSKTPREGLLLILKGMAEVFVSHEDQPEVLEVLQQGDMIGFSSLADFLGEQSENPEQYAVEVRAVEAATCLHIPYPVIEARMHDGNVRDFMLKQASIRLRDIYQSLAEQVKQASHFGESEPFIRRIQDLMSDPVVIVDQDEDIQDVAMTMVDKKTSSVVVVNDGDQLIGIITEKDLVSRVVAKGGGPGTVAKEVMTANPFIIADDAYYYEAMSSFLMNGIKHLPVMRRGRVVGMITLSDLLRKKNRGTMEILHTIEESTFETIEKMKPAIYEVLSNLIQDRIPTTHLLKVITKLYDRLVRHAVELAVRALETRGLGVPPVAFSWYMMGSGGRAEQFMLTDQDHFLVYANCAEEKREEVEGYFAELGREIVQHLEQAGYKRCQGLMMASEKNWRGSMRTWEERLRTWSLRATNDNILLGHNFLSYRQLYGDAQLHDEFVQLVDEKLTKSKIFLYRMAEQEKDSPVPTLDHPIRALFRMKRESIDLKMHALFPLHHCLQLLSAHHGIYVGTPLERLDKLTDKGVFEERVADEIRFAYEVVLSIRVDQAWSSYKSDSERTSKVYFAHLRTKDKEELIIALKTIRSLQHQALGAFGMY